MNYNGYQTFMFLNFNRGFCSTFEITFRRTSYGINIAIDQIARECNNLKNNYLFNIREL